MRAFYYAKRKEETMEKIRVLDKTELNILQGASENRITVLRGELSVEEVCSKMTEENLSEYSILSESGELSAIYRDKTVVLPILLAPDNGTITFNLTNVDMVQKRLRMLEAKATAIEAENTELKELVDTLVVSALEG